MNNKHSGKQYMKELQPNEIILVGSWLKEETDTVADDVCRRIEWLIKFHLRFLKADWSGWEKLYRDPNDMRFWELTYPQGEMHGGGPPQLEIISPETVVSKYQINP